MVAPVLVVYLKCAGGQSQYTALPDAQLTQNQKGSAKSSDGSWSI